MPQAHGKMLKAHGKAFAVRCTQQRVHGTVTDGEMHGKEFTAHGKELPAANGGRRRQNFAVSPILAHGKDCIQRVFYFRRAFFLGTRQMD